MADEGKGRICTAAVSAGCLAGAMIPCENATREKRVAKSNTGTIGMLRDCDFISKSKVANNMYFSYIPNIPRQIVLSMRFPQFLSGK
jgi:hypothetical protein